MFFVTDEPKLFNTETGCIFKVRGEYDDCCQVEVTGSASFYQSVFEGTRQECEDFIYSIAGWVGAVNPIAKAWDGCLADKDKDTMTFKVKKERGGKR